MSVRGKDLAQEEVKKYVQSNLAKFYQVQVRKMIDLPCLTETDRQNIIASYTNKGNNDTVYLFFQRLCCREDWVPYFVEALKEQHMGDLAAKLENLYQSKLLPPLKTRPPASAPPAANRPSVPPLQQANGRSRPEQHITENQALPSTPLGLAPVSANQDPQDMGDYRIPVQEKSHPVEKSKLAVHPKTPDEGAEPGCSFTSDVSSASNVGRARAVETTDPDAINESASVPDPVEVGPEPRVEHKWDGRQYHPVTVKNGCFGNSYRSQNSGMGSALPTGAFRNQPEENSYLSDSVSLALGGPREDSAAERKVYVLRGDQKGENPPAVDSPGSRPDSQRKNLPAYEGSPEDQTLPFMDPSNDAQPSFTQTGTKPPFPIPNPVLEHPVRLPPSKLYVSSSVGTKAPKPRQEFSAARCDRSSDDFKLPVKEERSSGEITGTDALSGRPQWGMEIGPPAVRDHKRDTNIFHSNSTENDMPSKPGVLCSDYLADDDGETDNMYSGTSERLRMSNKDSILVSTCDSDPILLSDSSSDGHSTASNMSGRNQPSGAVDATLPPEADAGEEDTSFRSHHLLVEENKSMDLMGVPLLPSPRDFPDSASDGQRENEAKDHQAGPSLPDENVEFEKAATGDFRMLFVGFALAFLASAVYVVYKKK